MELEEIYTTHKVKEKSIDLAVILENPCQLTIEVKEQETPPNGDNLEPNIEEFLACLAPLSTRECKNQNMVEEDMQVDGQEILGKTNYIEEWF